MSDRGARFALQGFKNARWHFCLELDPDLHALLAGIEMSIGLAAGDSILRTARHLLAEQR
jgi:hypothetical protein